MTPSWACISTSGACYTEGGPADRGYTFRGKPAGAVVRGWLTP